MRNVPPRTKIIFVVCVVLGRSTRPLVGVYTTVTLPPDLDIETLSRRDDKTSHKDFFGSDADLLTSKEPPISGKYSCFSRAKSTMPLFATPVLKFQRDQARQ